MNREEWLQSEIAKIKAGGTMRMRCTLSTPDRIASGLCMGDVPAARAHRGQDTCSAECAADKKRLRRWETAKGTCRACGHGLPRAKKPKSAKSPESGPSEGE